MMLKGQTILITGGAGFIGSHLSETLANDNCVIVYDNFSSSVLSPDSLGRLGKLRVVKGDILDQKNLDAAMRGVDVVFHLAVACVRLSLSRPAHVHDVNATGTLMALQAAKKARVKRFIYISSSEIYGTSQKRRMSETHPINPTTVYGTSKYVGELYTSYFYKHEGLPTVTIRPFNTYGPRSHFEGVYGEVIPRFTLYALNRKQPTIFGSGNQSRDFTYISDTVSGIVQAAQSDKLLGDCVNIARGHNVTIRTLAKTICRLARIPFRPIMKPSRPNDVFRHAADITKAARVLRYRPAVSIREGLIRYGAWLTKMYPDHSLLLKQIPPANW